MRVWPGPLVAVVSGPLEARVGLMVVLTMLARTQDIHLYADHGTWVRLYSINATFYRLPPEGKLYTRTVCYRVLRPTCHLIHTHAFQGGLFSPHRADAVC